MDLSLLGMLSAAGRGSSSSKKADGNPVQLDGLQGGVPFNEISVSGKNLIPFPYVSGDTCISYGVTFTVNSDGTITANGTISENGKITYILYKGNNLYLPAGTYTLSGLPNPDTITTSGRIVITSDKTDLIIYNQKGGKCTFTLSENKAIDSIYICWYSAGTVFDNVVFKPQLELGDTATEYTSPITGREMILNVNGTECTITPDSNPYTVPIDIIQKDGINVLSIADDSNPTISVSGNKASEQLGTIFRTLNNKPVLLFDGTIPTSSSAGYAEFTIDKEYSALIIVPICNDSNVYEPGACTIIPIGYITEEEQGFSVFSYPRAIQRINRPFIKRIDNTIYVRSISTACSYMTIYGI